jgi:hypothetical protein
MVPLAVVSGHVSHQIRSRTETEWLRRDRSVCDASEHESWHQQSARGAPETTADHRPHARVRASRWQGHRVFDADVTEFESRRSVGDATFAGRPERGIDSAASSVPAFKSRASARGFGATRSDGVAAGDGA